jgi:hypothetical protein
MLVNPQQQAATSYRIQLQSNASQEYRRELRHGVATALSQGQRRIVVDCESWSDLDLVLLSALVNCAKACSEFGAFFELQNLRSDLRSRIDALHLADRLGLTA